MLRGLSWQQVRAKMYRVATLPKEWSMMFSMTSRGSARDMADVYEAAGLKGKEPRTKGREVSQPPNALPLGNCQHWESSVTDQSVGHKYGRKRKWHGIQLSLWHDNSQLQQE